MTRQANRIATPVSSVRMWPGMRSEYTWSPPYAGSTVTRPQQVGVSFAENGGVALERGGKTVTLDVRPGDVFANGRQELRWSPVTRPDEVVEIYPDAALLRAAAGVGGEVEIEPLTAVRDPVVLAIAATLKRAHVHGAAPDELHADTLAHRLADHLVAHYCGIRPARPREPGRLDRPTLQRVSALVEARLGEPLTIGDLAAAAHLSPFHFARAFKATTGIAPHAFVTSRRMERAKALLMRGGLGAADVAHRVGYTNLRHFRRVLHRWTGFMPGQLRTGPAGPPQHSKNGPS